MHKMAVNGNSYYLNETTRFGTELAASHDLMPDHLTLYAGSSEVLHFRALAFTLPTRSFVAAGQTWRVAASQGATVHKLQLRHEGHGRRRPQRLRLALFV
jgi:hypothetical protein